jgi:hypothetical protein
MRIRSLRGKDGRGQDRGEVRVRSVVAPNKGEVVGRTLMS